LKTLSDEYAKDDYDIKCNVFNKLYYEILDKEVNLRRNNYEIRNNLWRIIRNYEK